MRGVGLRTEFLQGLFTPQERKALGFLLALGSLGLAVMACRKGPAAAPFSAAPAGISVNRAAPEELVSLPGIGPVLAGRIAEDRQRRGFYLTLNDLGRVKGVTPKMLKRLRGWVRFD